MDTARVPMTLRLPEDLMQRVQANARREWVSVNKWMIYAALERADRQDEARETEQP